MSSVKLVNQEMEDRVFSFIERHPIRCAYLDELTRGIFGSLLPGSIALTRNACNRLVREGAIKKHIIKKPKNFQYEFIRPPLRGIQLRLEDVMTREMSINEAAAIMDYDRESNRDRQEVDVDDEEVTVETTEEAEEEEWEDVPSPYRKEAKEEEN